MAPSTVPLDPRAARALRPDAGLGRAGRLHHRRAAHRRRGAQADVRAAPGRHTLGQDQGDLAWHRTTVTAPEAAAGRKLILAPGVANSEGLVFVNGVARGVIGSLVKQPFFLSFSAAAGETFDILIESYAGNHPRNCCVGAVPLDRDLVPEYHPESDPAIGETTFGLWVDDAWELYVDVKTLWELADKLAPESQFVAEIHQALMDFTLIAQPRRRARTPRHRPRAPRRRLAVAARRNATQDGPHAQPPAHAG
ncbi:MAG: hypothetical protein ACYTFO_09670 [Planctomycetota bacterium]|jgi:hypothetical protein